MPGTMMTRPISRKPSVALLVAIGCSAFHSASAASQENQNSTDTAFASSSYGASINAYGSSSLGQTFSLTQDIPEGVTECGVDNSSGNLAPYFLTQANVFCINSGTCKQDPQADPNNPCDCLQGFVGPHCEFLDNEVPACDLECQNGGVCMVGAKSWQQVYSQTFWETPQDKRYCSCPAGTSGELCESRGTPCGDNAYCYNGASCVQTVADDGSVQDHCDCTTAGNHNSSSSSENAPKFAGEFCQYEASTYCSARTDQNGQQICVNGGTCKTESHMGCYCPEGFTGPVCEFVDLDVAPMECSMQCSNHGICRKGAKDLSILRQFGLNRHLIASKGYNENFEHCVCPTGYAGLQCEYKFDICPIGDHACMNGGACITFVEGGQVHSQCDCSSAGTPTSRFTGSFCEMESTQFCTVSGQKTPRGPGEDAFCTNGGTCKALVNMGDAHPGCNCPPGFEGDQCEYPVGDASRDKKHYSTMLVATVIAGTCTLLVGSLIYIHERRRTRQLAAENQRFAKAPTMAQIRSMGTWKPAPPIPFENRFQDHAISDSDDDDDDVEEDDIEEDDASSSEEDELSRESSCSSSRVSSWSSGNDTGYSLDNQGTTYTIEQIDELHLQHPPTPFPHRNHETGSGSLGSDPLHVFSNDSQDGSVNGMVVV